MPLDYLKEDEICVCRPYMAFLTNDTYEIKKINYVLWEVVVYIGVNGCHGESSFYFYFL